MLVNRGGGGRSKVDSSIGPASFPNNENASVRKNRKLSANEENNNSSGRAFGKQLDPNQATTPAAAATTKRRAFGTDISNRKPGTSVRNKNAGSLASFQKSSKKSVSFHQTPRASKPSSKPFSSTNHRTFGTPASVLRQNNSDARPSSTKKVSFAVPQRSKGLRIQESDSKSNLHHKAAAASKNKTEIFQDVVEDVEFPAGRLYGNERDWESDEEDDTSLSIEGADKVREELQDFFVEINKQQMQKQIENRRQADQALTDRIVTVYKNDNDISIYDLVDDMEHLMNDSLKLDDLDYYDSDTDPWMFRNRQDDEISL